MLLLGLQVLFFVLLSFIEVGLELVQPGLEFGELLLVRLGLFVCLVVELLHPRHFLLLLLDLGLLVHQH